MKCKLGEFFANPNEDWSKKGTSIDVTKEVAEAFTNYFSVFGTKEIDFNVDVSPFGNLKDILGEDVGQ